MAKNKVTKGVTPIGEALFAHVLKTETIHKKDGKTTDTGKFTIMLKLKDSDKEALLDKINAEWESFKETLDNKKFKYEISNGLKEYNDEEYFKFSMNETIKLKSGELLHRTVPIYDAKCNEISGTLTGIGNGSKVKIAFDYIPFYMNDKNYGVSLRLTGIQIIDLIEYGQTDAKSLGFGEEEGYSQNEAVDDEDLPFTCGEEEDDDEGDF